MENNEESVVRIAGVCVLTIFFWLLGGVDFAVATQEEAEQDARGLSSWGSFLNLATTGELDDNLSLTVTPQSLFSEVTEDSQVVLRGRASRYIRPIGLPTDSQGRRSLTARRSISLATIYEDLPSTGSVLQTGKEEGGAYSHGRVSSPGFVNDSTLHELIALSDQFADGRKSEGFWRKFVWSLAHWIIERSWYGEARGFVPMVESPEKIKLIELTSVPELSIFLTRLVAIEKTFDEYWVIHGESTNATMLRYLKSAISSNIRGVVGQVAVFGGRDDVNVVASTANVVHSLLLVAGRYYGELTSRSVEYPKHWLEQIRIFSDVSDSMGSLVKLASTPADLQLAMAVMEVATGWLDGEARFADVSPIGLGGLIPLQEILSMFFEGGLETVEMDLPRFSSADYQQLLKYVRLLLKGDLLGLMPVDLEKMDNPAYQDIIFHALSDGQPAVLTSEIIARVVTREQWRTIMGGETNMRLFALLCSSAGEAQDTFELLHRLSEAGDRCVEQESGPCLESQLALEAFLADKEVASYLGDLGEQMNSLTLTSDNRRGDVQGAVRPPDEDSIRPANAAGTSTEGGLSAPFLPDAVGMGGKQ